MVQKWTIELNFGTHVEDNRGNNVPGSVFQNLIKGTSAKEGKIENRKHRKTSLGKEAHLGWPGASRWGQPPPPWGLGPTTPWGLGPTY